MSTPYTLMRCRMKDLISCFNGCKVIEKDVDDESDQQNPKTSSGTGVDIREHNRDQMKQVEDEPTTVVGGGGKESPASWQSCESEEDEYIVFYFKDDDVGGDVIEERGLDSSSSKKQVAVHGRNRLKIVLSVIDRQETRKTQVGAKHVPVETEDQLNHESEHQREGSSDSSTSSFAFPAIQREWPGSPVLMPRPEGHNKRSVCVQCCKF
ncbi:uncharacterized protein [Rutidosis leptorrhynchoides]|uniref:uncharacterized protein n=1 Tax=Rutidosis leptorrhynchoides TaxID=125765 RepID=UPI003A9A26F4